MEITAIPAQRSSAYQEALFTLSAAESEIIDLDIREETQNLLLGKKKLSGQTAYSINVSNYAQQLLEVTPLRANETVFDYPTKRMTTIQIQAGDVKSSVILTSGLQKILFFEKLTKAPDSLVISPDQSDEIALYTDDSALYADVILSSSSSTRKIRLAEKNKQTGLCALYFHMPHVVQQLTQNQWEPIDQYHLLELQITTEYDELICSRKYRIEPSTENKLRLCWWNYFGQIDYYSFKIAQTSLLIDKQRIYTDQGYKTTGCQTESRYELVSDYLNQENMNWIQEIAASPKVWIDNGTEFIPIEILTQQIMTGGNQLARLQLSIAPSLKSFYQHL